MPKYILNVAENWYRKYLVDAETEDTVIDTYLAWTARGGDFLGNVAQLSDPEFIDDGPVDAFIVEGEYKT